MNRVPGTTCTGSISTTPGLVLRWSWQKRDRYELITLAAALGLAENSKAPGQRLADRAAFWLVTSKLDHRSPTNDPYRMIGASLSSARYMEGCSMR
jgi:hypothetical protein